MSAPHALRVELKDLLIAHFNSAELDDLAFRLNITELPQSMGLSLKAQEIVEHLHRRNRLADLGEVGPVVRDDLPWRQILGKYGYAPQVHVSTELSYLDLQKLLPILAEYPLFQTPDGRRSVLYTAGVSNFVNVDLNGSSRQVANILLAELNRYGKTAEGDIALGRLLKYLMMDDALPPAHKETITAIMTDYYLG